MSHAKAQRRGTLIFNMLRMQKNPLRAANTGLYVYGRALYSTLIISIPKAKYTKGAFQLIAISFEA